MSDLISRKALLRKICEWSNKLHPSNSKQFTLSEFEWLVNNHPIAYDVKKVIEEIDKASDYYECEDAPNGTDSQMIFLTEAIDIVKGGRIDE